MPKVLAIFGATGNQGGSVANYVLADPELSKEYSVRAITRNVNSAKAQELKKKGAEVVAGDLADAASLKTALSGVHTVFIVTAPIMGPDAVEVEFNQIKNAADTSVELGAQYIIFSTLPSVAKISGGKYLKVTAFEAKAKAEEYIRTLPVKSAFFSAGSFMENFRTPGVVLHRTAPDGTDIVSRHNSPKTKIPLLAVVDDTGKFIGAILAEPDKYAGATFCAGTALYTWPEIAATLTKVTGIKTVYEQCSVEEYRDSLPPFLQDYLTEGFSYWDDFGYYGPETEELVKWAAEQARGKLTTLEEYVQQHPEPLA